jgi:drug/metabolite transporter (DMT)-like permease
MSRGVAYMLIATFFFSTMNVCVKLLPHIPAVEIVFFRSIISLVISLIILRSVKVNIWGKNRKYLILRGVSGAIALILYFRMMQAIPLASATVILFLSPIFTTIIGIFMNNEKVKPVQWLFFLISFLGIVLIKGFDARVPLFFVITGIIASAASGLAYNCIRKLNTSEHPMVIIFYFPLITIPVTGAISSFQWKMPDGYDWLILLAVGVLTQTAQYFMTKSYQLEEVSKVASLRYLGIIYALFFGFLLFDEHFNWKVYVGMAITLSGVILNIWYKHNRLRFDMGIFKDWLTN